MFKSDLMVEETPLIVFEHRQTISHMVDNSSLGIALDIT
jgi:hypothetical protein